MRSAVFTNYINVVFTGVATLAESRTVFTHSAVRTDICTIAAHTAVRAEGDTFSTGRHTVGTEANTVSADRFTILAHLYTFAAVSAQFAHQVCVFFANVAAGAKFHATIKAIRAVVIRAESSTFGTRLTVVAPHLYTFETYVAIFAREFAAVTEDALVAL